MLRALTLLALFIITAEASAQTVPATKTTARRATPRKAAAKAPSAAAAPARSAPSSNGAVGSTENADDKGQNVYAAPGMPVNVDNPRKVEGYNGPAPTKPRSRTTLAPR